MMDSLVLLSRRRRRHRRRGGDGGDKGETENEQLTTTMLLILSVESRKEKILKVPKHSYVLLARTQKVIEILKIPHKNIDTKRFVSNISRTRIRHGICKRMGVSPERQRQGRTSMVRGRFGVGFRFFFSRKMMRPTLFFLAAVKGFRAMEKRRGKRDGREGVGVDRDAEVRDAECFRLDFLFVPLVSSNAGGVDGGWSPFLRAFFSSFSLLAFGWTSR